MRNHLENLQLRIERLERQAANRTAARGQLQPDLKSLVDETETLLKRHLNQALADAKELGLDDIRDYLYDGRNFKGEAKIAMESLRAVAETIQEVTRD